MHHEVVSLRRGIQAPCSKCEAEQIAKRLYLHTSCNMAQLNIYQERYFPKALENCTATKMLLNVHIADQHTPSQNKRQPKCKLASCTRDVPFQHL
eukprot:2180989-Amphidinium_carterae.1